jgi:hypothetical protein
MSKQMERMTVSFCMAKLFISVKFLKRGGAEKVRQLLCRQVSGSVLYVRSKFGRQMAGQAGVIRSGWVNMEGITA